MTIKQAIYKNQKSDYRQLMPLCGTYSAHQGKNIKKLSAINLLNSLICTDRRKKSGLVCLQTSTPSDQYP